MYFWESIDLSQEVITLVDFTPKCTFYIQKSWTFSITDI